MRARHAGGRPVAIFSMPMESHFRRLRPVIAGLAERGVPVVVFTHRAFRELVEGAGGSFEDLFARHAVEDVDAESTLIGCRHVSFAGHCADDVLAELRELDPGLVVYETFAVIARVVAASLGVPAVNVCNGHNVDPRRYLAEMRDAVPLVVSDRCREAVELLRGSGVAATPFSYLDGMSRYLNLYCEPPEWLPASARGRFEPIAFYGSLPPAGELSSVPVPPRLFPDDGRLKVYVSLGTVVWHYWPTLIRETLETIVGFLARCDDVAAVVTVGRTSAQSATIDVLTRPSVAAAAFVDQWQALSEADVFVTHNGLSSTHEAVFHGVPMLGYPVFADQPELAELCRSFGLGFPLVDAPRGRLTDKSLACGLAAVSRNPDEVRAAFARARSWEMATVRRRDAIHDQLLALRQA